MTASIRSCVSSRTKGEALITRETVFFETPARRAMSLIVGRRRRPSEAPSSGACDLLIGDFTGGVTDPSRPNGYSYPLSRPRPQPPAFTLAGLPCGLGDTGYHSPMLLYGSRP